jgi:vacuolar-type H+-ATPase subunit C/Vma6
LQQLLGWYAILIRSAPAGRQLFLALAGLHEIENVKLLWRAATRGHAFTRWSPLWRPLGAVETVSAESCRDCRSLAAIAEALSPTPYAEVVESMRRAHSADPVAAELGFDRWASRRLADRASALPAREHAARALALDVVRERDLNLLRRGVRTFRLSPDAVVAGLVQLPGELGAAALQRLAEWTPADAPLAKDWPRMWRRVAGGATEWNGLMLAWRRARREACRRAFLGQPFCLAPAVALLLFGEEEVRGLTAVGSLGDDTPPAVMEEILAASLLGV